MAFDLSTAKPVEKKGGFNAATAKTVGGARQEQQQEEPGAMDYLSSALGGVNELVPAIAGLPVDFATNAANLAIGSYGTARHKIGQVMGEQPGEYQIPEMLPPMAGGSEWIRKKIDTGFNALGGGSPFGVPEHETRGQQNVRMASSILGAGLINPSAALKDIPRNVLRMVPSASGAVVAKELFPDQPLAPIAGMLAGPAALQGVRSVSTPAKQAFINAHKLGYKVPPALAKPSVGQQAVEGAAGPVPLKQRASLHNQKITNSLIKKDIGYPKDVPLSREGLDAVRAETSTAYNAAKKAGIFTTDKAFKAQVRQIANQNSAIAKEFPGLVKKDIAKMASNFNKQKISSEALVEAVKQLRKDATAGFRSNDPGTLAMARAQNKMASALEGLMERSVAKSNPSLLPDLRAARQRIAKTYQVEKALKGENVDAVALARDLDKGRPMSGLMRQVAEFGQNFKGAAQVNPPQQVNFRPMDYMTGIGGTAITGQPSWLALILARPALRSIALSKPYQGLLSRADPSKVRAILELPKESQAAALTTLLDDLQTSEPE